MSQSSGPGKRYPVSGLCGLFGLSRQGYYKHSYRDEELDVLISSIVHYCRHVRNHLPHSGCRQLHHLCIKYFGEKFILGRDRFFDVLRSNGLMLRRKRYRPHTTNSNHPYRIYEDLLNTYPKYIPTSHGCLLVADITYIATCEGFAYLSLLTDGYSRAIVGYALHPTLSSEGPLKALQMALDFYHHRGIETQGIIHHSDRGIQYASKEYTKKLLENQARISMTQTGDPLHNALAERMNNTVKNGWLYDCGEMNFEQAREKVDKAIYSYNWMRPHQAINMRTPMQMYSQNNCNPLLVVGHDQPQEKNKEFGV